MFLHELKTKKGKKRPNEDDEDEDEDEEIAESGRMALDELVAAYSDFQTVGMLHFLGDVCEQLSVTSPTLQGSELDIDVVLSNIDGLITSLKNDYPASGSIRWGPRMRKFIARCPTIGSTCPSDISIAGKHAIKVTAAKRDALYQAARDAAELVSIALNERMPDAAIITALLKLFDARALPTTIPAEYGDLELDTVLEHFAPHAKAAESATKADADPTNAELKADAARTSKRSESIKAPDFVDADKMRSQWTLFKNGMLKKLRGSSYRTVYRLIARSESMSELYSELLKTGNVLVLIALSNAISERGFSLLNHTKTKKKARLANPGLDCKLRCVSLGPTDEEGIEATVDAATVTIFGKAIPGRAAGAVAANAVRNAKRARLETTAISAAGIISGKKNDAVADDSSAAQSVTAGVVFPSDKYKMDVALPVLDKPPVGKKVLYLYDDKMGGGYKYKAFSVTKGKQPKRADAAGAVLDNPAFKYTLQIGKKGECFTTKLPPHQFGVDKKWYLAVKK